MGEADNAGSRQPPEKECLLGRRLLEASAGQRQQLLDHRLLLHRVDEPGVAEIDDVDLAADEGVEHDLHRPDQALEKRRVAELHRVARHLDADPVQEGVALVADRDRLRAAAALLAWLASCGVGVALKSGLPGQLFSSAL